MDAGDLTSNGPIEVSSTSGRIEVESLRAPKITVNSVSGSVDSPSTAFALRCHLSSTSGQVEADLLGADHYTINAHTTSGSITIGGEQRSTLTKGDGSSKITLQTVSGSISVRP